MAHIRALEVATFYTMFNLEPVGKFHVQLCGTTPCRLRGADDLEKLCKKKIGEQGEVTEDGKFSWVEVECLGACVNAPMVQINADYYEDLTKDSFNQLLDALRGRQETEAGPASEAAIVRADRRADHAARDGPNNTRPRNGGREGATDAKAKKPGAAANLQEAPALEGMPDKAKPKPN